MTSRNHLIKHQVDKVKLVRTFGSSVVHPRFLEHRARTEGKKSPLLAPTVKCRSTTVKYCTSSSFNVDLVKC